MKKLSIAIAEKKKHYPIYIGNSILSEIKNDLNLLRYSHIAIITDRNISDKIPEIKKILPIQPTEIIIDPGEINKTIDTVEKIWRNLIESKFDRKSLVINLGGGVIGDMGGFAAATYMRGIDFIQIPTTLLAMVDASVGGKLAVDFDGYKNIVGSFSQPKAMVIETKFLDSLPDREFISGFAEIIKHGLIADKNYFETVIAKIPKEFSKEELTGIIARSCKIKSEIVEKDEQESGLRKVLNFGHTIGHAVESISLKTVETSRRDVSTIKSILHGEAIAIGMVAEAKLSSLIGNLDAAEFDTIRSNIQKAGLPVSAKGIKKEEIMQMLMYDKKNEHGKIKWTLLKQIGKAVFDVEVDNHLVEQAVDNIIT